jgi:succinyldiaminopimelate transaminase
VSGSLASRLPDFPWDLLEPHARLARTHADGIVDLSIGTPVDDVPASVQAVLAKSTNTPGYPLTHGTAAFRSAVDGWLQRRLGAEPRDPASVLPTVGSKEFVSLLPMLLGLGAGETVVIPSIAYPTYEVGARAAGCRVVVADDPQDWGDAPRLVWINTPSNPTGAVLDAARLRALVDAARAAGALLVSDECYVELGWEAQPVSVLHRDVTGADPSGVLAVHSLSKRSNLAGYRAGFVSGDPGVVAELLAARRHLGLMVPSPIIEAATAAIGDDDHVEQQRQRYARRRSVLRPALESAGLRVEHSEAGLYLWVTRGDACWDTVQWLAERGILVAPGEFYGDAGSRHVRVALTATDERIDAAVARLT